MVIQGLGKENFHFYLLFAFQTSAFTSMYSWSFIAMK
jgi:hypothetical protein